MRHSLPAATLGTPAPAAEESFAKQARKSLPCAPLQSLVSASRGSTPTGSQLSRTRGSPSHSSSAGTEPAQVPGWRGNAEKTPIKAQAMRTVGVLSERLLRNGDRLSKNVSRQQALVQARLHRFRDRNRDFTAPSPSAARQPVLPRGPCGEAPPPNFPREDCLPTWSGNAGHSSPSQLRRPKSLPSLPPAPESPRELLLWIEHVIDGRKGNYLEPLKTSERAQEDREDGLSEAATESRAATPKVPPNREWLRRLEQQAQERWRPPAEETPPEGPLGLLTPRTLEEIVVEPVPPPPRPKPLRKLPDVPECDWPPRPRSREAPSGPASSGPAFSRDAQLPADEQPPAAQPPAEQPPAEQPPADGGLPRPSSGSSHEAPQRGSGPPTRGSMLELPMRAARPQSPSRGASSPTGAQTPSRRSPRPSSRTSTRGRSRGTARQVSFIIDEPSDVNGKQDAAARIRVFQDLDVDGDIPVDRLEQALKRLGYRGPNAAWIEELIARYQGRSHMDREEFLEFAQNYEDMFRESVREKLQAVGKDRSGLISAAELKELIRMEGVTPVPALLEDLMNEFPESERTEAKWIGVDQFIKMSNNMIDRFAFTRAEVEELFGLFEHFDRDGDGRITAAELRASLAWAGFRASPEAVMRIRGALEQPPEALLTKADYFKFMRSLREKFCEDVHFALAHHSPVTRSELVGIFESLGHRAVTPEVVDEALQDCGASEKESYDFDDVFTLVEKVRQKEELLRHQREEADAAFAKYSGGKKLIAGIELIGAVRFLGYPQTLEQIQEILAEFDSDENGALDQPEFIKVVRRYREEMIVSVRQSFSEHDVDKDGNLSLKEVRGVFLKAGQVMRESELVDMLEEHSDKRMKVDLWRFAALMEKHRLQVRNKQRANQGFTDIEVRKFTAFFNRFDPDSVGEVSNKNLADLIEKLFPDVRSDQATHARAKALLQEIDEDQDGQLDLREFLSMMRRVQDDQDEKRLASDQEAIEASRFSRAEVKEFRKVFQMFDSDESGELSFEDVKAMLGGIVPLGDNASKSLLSTLKTIDHNGDREINFVEYLQLMRRLQDEDWNGINSRVSAVADAARQDEEARKLSESAATSPANAGHGAGTTGG